MTVRRPSAILVCAGLVGLGWPSYARDVSAQQVPTPPSVFEYDRTDPLDVVVRKRSDHEGFTLVDLDYASPVTGRVPSLLYEPAEPAGPSSPGVIMLHGVPGTRGAMHRLSAAYARAGVYVMAISAPGARPMPYRELRIIPLPTFDEHDREELIQLIRDLRRAVDFLQANPAIAGDRIGFIGHSAGGMAGAILAAVDARITASVLMAPTPGWVSWLHSLEQRPRRVREIGRGDFDALSAAERAAWIAQMEPLEATHWIGRADGTPLLVQGGERDRSVPRADVEALARAAREPKTLRWYDAGHFLGEAAFAEGAAFLSAQLGFDVSRFVAPHRLY